MLLTHRGQRNPFTAIAALFVLAGCAAPTVPPDPCCYAGAYSKARLADVRLVLANGQAQTFAALFPDFRAGDGWILTPLPFQEADIAQVSYDTARAAMLQYDANGNGLIEAPELTVLYIREAARGLGHQVAHLEASPRTAALVLPAADIDGLMQWLKRNRSRMTPQAQALTADLERVGLDLRNRGSEGGDEGSKGDGGFNT